MNATTSVTELFENVILDVNGCVIGTHPEQRLISRAQSLIREMNRIGKKEAIDVTEAKSEV